MSEFKDLTFDDDSRSVFSSNDILMNKTYSEEDAMRLIKEMCIGYSSEQATKAVDQLINKIKNHKLEVDSNVPESIFGRSVHEYITHSIKLGGESVIACTKSNVPLERVLSTLRTSRTFLDAELNELQKKVIVPVEPNETFLKSKYRVEKADRILLLEEGYKERYFSRVKNDTADEDEDAVPVIRSSRTKKSLKKEKQRKEVRDDDDDDYLNDQDSNWLRSPEYKRYQTSVLDLTSKIELEFDREYVNALKDYQLHQAAYVKSITEIKDVDTQLRHLNVCEVFINGLQSVMVNIATSVCNAVRRYPTIKTKLECQVTLAKGEHIVDPLGKNSLPGIYAILYRDYSKASLDVFCTMLLQLMSEDHGYEISVNHPEVGVQKVLQELRQWEQLDLYAYMSKDKLFTVALLKSYHPKSEVRIRGVTVVIEFVRRLERGEVAEVASGDHSDMPIFLHLIDWIERVHGVSKKFGKGESTTLSTKSNSVSNDKKQQQAHTNWSQKNMHKTGLEQAAAASVSVVDQDAQGPYNAAVNRDARLMVTLTEGGGAGKRVPYTATQSQCDLCYVAGSREKKNSGNHKPYCFGGQCHKCHLYGHRNSHCLQQLSKELPAKQG